jgi:hypothetical protein
VKWAGGWGCTRLCPVDPSYQLLSRNSGKIDSLTFSTGESTIDVDAPHTEPVEQVASKRSADLC